MNVLMHKQAHCEINEIIAVGQITKQDSSLES